MASKPSAVARRSTKSEYFETETHNKISRRAHIEGKQNIMLGGYSVIMAGVVMRGDLRRLPEPVAEGERTKQPQITAITVGKFSVISTNCTIRPPMQIRQGQMSFFPMRIGDNVFIGAGTHISSAAISSHVHIGANCVLGPFSMIKECSKILPDTVVPANMVVPPGAIVGGQPARIIGQVGEGWGQTGDVDESVEGGELRSLVRSIK